MRKIVGNLVYDSSTAQRSGGFFCWKKRTEVLLWEEITPKTNLEAATWLHDKGFAMPADLSTEIQEA
jgi:hypothetical protein